MNSVATENRSAAVDAQPEIKEVKSQAPAGPPPLEEVDVWWGSFASRTMLPSFLGCILGTVIAAWFTWMMMSTSLVKASFLALAGALWILQLVRWGYRWFGYNYRLTTRRLFCHRGWLYGPEAQIELARVARVLVKRGWHERLVGVGQVLVLGEDAAQPPLILEGIFDPARIAEQIRLAVQRAREQGVVETKVVA